MKHLFLTRARQLVLLALLTTLVSVFFLLYRERKRTESFLVDHCTSGKNFRFSQLCPSCDTLYVFGPYTSNTHIKSTVGIGSYDPPDLRMNDSYNLVLMVRNKKVISSQLVRRDKVDIISHNNHIDINSVWGVRPQGTECSVFPVGRSRAVTTLH